MFDLSTLGLTVASILVQIVCAVWRWAVHRQTHWFLFVLCFADVCWNALLEESLVIHGCSEEGALPHYGCRNQSFCCPLGAFKKLIEKYNATGLYESNYEEYVGIEAVTFFRYLFVMTVQTLLVLNWFTVLIKSAIASVNWMISSCLTMKHE